jgi:hypothetical protein
MLHWVAAFVAVEKVDIHKNSMILGDGKWSDVADKSVNRHSQLPLFCVICRGGAVNEMIAAADRYRYFGACSLLA